MYPEDKEYHNQHPELHKNSLKTLTESSGNITVAVTNYLDMELTVMTDSDATQVRKHTSHDYPRLSLIYPEFKRKEVFHTEFSMTFRSTITISCNQSSYHRTNEQHMVRSIDGIFSNKKVLYKTKIQSDSSLMENTVVMQNLLRINLVEILLLE